MARVDGSVSAARADPRGSPVMRDRMTPPKPIMRRLVEVLDRVCPGREAIA
jgi:hypothetical protein